jgi:hypothetical protein
MKRIIVDYAKLTNEILDLLVEKFPEGYEETDVISFTNSKSELIEAVELRTDDAIYLVKVSKRLADRMESHEVEDIDLDFIDVPQVDLKEVDDDLVDDDEEFEYDKPDDDKDEDDDEGLDDFELDDDFDDKD